MLDYDIVYATADCKLFKTSHIETLAAADVNSKTNLTLTGSNSGSEDVHGNAGNNVLRGLAGSDALFGDVSSDTLEGGAGADLMIGGAHIDKYIVNNINNIVIDFAGKGIDTVHTTSLFFRGEHDISH